MTKTNNMLTHWNLSVSQLARSSLITSYFKTKKLIINYLFFVGHQRPDIFLNQRIQRKILMNKRVTNTIGIHQKKKKNLNPNIRVKEGKIC